MKSMIIVNFGGPRSLKEVESFLIALLTDQDVVRSPFPKFFHRWFFTRVAKKRTHKVSEDYALIGGKSPIFEDTNAVATAVGEKFSTQVLTFHRYLPETHAAFIEQVETLTSSEILIFPMFPQFSYATTGSIARFFKENLSPSKVCKMRWIKSYCDHPAYVASMQKNIATFLAEQQLDQKETLLLFSAHGLPKAFIDTGDVYQQECERSFHAIAAAFPDALSKLSYQSKFGRGEWLRPYTEEFCQEILEHTAGRSNVVFIPLSFTSDHIETLFEVEKLYLPIVQDLGLRAFRCPAPNRALDWIEAIASIYMSAPHACTCSLLFNQRKNNLRCKSL